jgi:hypothetical protein
MGRPPKPEDDVASVTLTIRLTTSERDLLTLLVQHRQADGAPWTAASVVRALIKDAAADIPKTRKR